MTRIVVAAKQNKILLQDSQSKTVTLDQPSIIQIGVTQQDVKTLERSGDKLIVTLKNGEQIVLDGFFQADASTVHSLAFPKADGSFSLANFNANGKFTNYSGLQKLDALLYEGADAVPIQQVKAYESTAVASESDFSFSNLLSSSAVKAGLGIAAAVGLGLALIDDGGSNSSGTIDVTKPEAPKNVVLSEDGKTITGTAEAGTTVYVVDKNEKVIVSAIVDKDGKFTVELPEALLNNNNYYINVKDKAGNSSNYTTVTGTKDTIAPDEPQAQLNDQGNIVTGKTEANATVNVYDSAGNLIGTAKASSDGQFSVAISPVLSAGQKGTVEAVDASGNKSGKHTIEFGKDTVAPDQPKFEVTTDGTSIKGTAEANAKVIIQDSTGTVIGTGTVDANGKFTVTVTPALSSSTAGKIIIEDAAGNQSKSLEIKAGQDILAPNQPVANLNAEGTIITGTAEANSKIAVYDSGNKLLGTATVDASGNYSITLSTALTEGKTATVYATDTAGNQSPTSTVTGTKDITAPGVPKISDVTDDVGDTKGSIASNGTTDDKRPVISGTGEAGATLIVSDNGKAIGNVTVGTDGKWSFSFDSDLSVGSHSITAVQTDKAGNTSLASDARTFTVVEIATTTTNSLEETSLSHVLSANDPTSATTETYTDSTTSSTATGIAASSTIEPSSIATVLGSTKSDAESVSSTNGSQLANTLKTSDLVTDATESSATNTIDQVINTAIATSPATNADIASLTASTATTNNVVTTKDISVVQTDVLNDLLNQQVVTF